MNVAVFCSRPFGVHDIQPLQQGCFSVSDFQYFNLRSVNRRLLNFPRNNMKNYYGRRAFSYAGPHAWNSLPEHLRQTTSIDLLKLFKVPTFAAVIRKLTYSLIDCIRLR